MKGSQASQTAEYVALFRAIESAKAKSRRIFNDPFARLFLKPSLRLVVSLTRLTLIGGLLTSYIERRWTGAMTSAIARTRYIDDQLLQSLANGIEQLVILGAGFDSRAYRIPGIEKIQVFEIDHPATQAAKRAKLAQILGQLPQYVTFVSIDFNTQHLAEVLAASGFDPQRKSLFIWEGVTNYLTEEAVSATIDCIQTSTSGSLLLFTYVHRDMLTHPEGFVGAQHMQRTFQGLGEAWTFGFLPQELAAYLQKHGLQLLSDLGASEYRKHYLGQPGKGYTFYRIALAKVQG